MSNSMARLPNGPSSTAERARGIAAAGGFEAALAAGMFDAPLSMPMAEALVLGLMRQGIRKFLAIFGHGSTAIADVLRLYEAHGLLRTFQFRHETAMAHAATALRWIYCEPSAVVTSIGPGALQAMAGSLVAASNGVGVYHLYGDETTHGEGYNMQAIPQPRQGLYGQLTGVMGQSYTLHTPEALRAALRRGRATVFHPTKAGPFFLLLPINTQPRTVSVNISALPDGGMPGPGAPAGDEDLKAAASIISKGSRVAIKAGGGSRRFAAELTAFAEAASAPVILSPGSTGVLPDGHPLNMHVGGSKGSISGNFAMAEAETLIVIGSRAVCQSDCSGIGYPRVREVININADLDDVTHYNHTIALQGDIGAILRRLTPLVRSATAPARSRWLDDCRRQKTAWVEFKSRQFAAAPLLDAVWGMPVLTQPVAIKTVADFCKANECLKLFDAGDVQANGFQIVEDDTTADTVTESGASYMGFAVSALLAGGLAERPRYAVAFSGDGSFMMQPQVLIDAVEHRVRGMIVIFDNRRMAAISGLQEAQYGAAFRTSDTVAVDYVRLAQAVAGIKAVFAGTTVEGLQQALVVAHQFDGLSVVHVPVYHGENPAGGMGAYGRWNVGNWCEDVERDYAAQDL